VVGGSNPLTPTITQAQSVKQTLLNSPEQLIDGFITSRRQGLSPRTIEFYQTCLSPLVLGYEITSEGINSFLSNLSCGNAKLNYYRAITVFVHWLIREGFLKDNPQIRVDKPKPAKRLLPSVTEKDADALVGMVDSLRDKCVISMLADSGMRLNEIANIKACDIDWSSFIITIIGKGNKQRRAPFTDKTAKLLQTSLKIP
jgi:integrase/recombinase XerD